MYKGSTKRAEALAVVNRIRELVAQNMSYAAIAKAVDRDPTYVSYVSRGLRPRTTKKITVESLGLRRVAGIQCRRCERVSYIVGPSSLCAECEISDLAKKGVILLRSA